MKFSRCNHKASLVNTNTLVDYDKIDFHNNNSIYLYINSVQRRLLKHFHVYNKYNVINDSEPMPSGELYKFLYTITYYTIESATFEASDYSRSPMLAITSLYSLTVNVL